MTAAGTLHRSGPQFPHLGPKERSRLPTSWDPTKPLPMYPETSPASNNTAWDPEGTPEGPQHAEETPLDKRNQDQLLSF